jgi:hypothetical protein
MRPLNLAQRYALEMAFESAKDFLQLFDYRLIDRSKLVIVGNKESIL